MKNYTILETFYLSFMLGFTSAISAQCIKETVSGHSTYEWKIAISMKGCGRLENQTVMVHFISKMEIIMSVDLQRLKNGG